MTRDRKHHSAPDRLAAAADHLNRVWSGARHPFLRDLAFAKACEAHGLLLRQARETLATVRPRSKAESTHGRWY